MSKFFLLLPLTLLACLVSQPNQGCSEPVQLRASENPGPMVNGLLEDAGHQVYRRGGVWFCEAESRDQLWDSLASALARLREAEEIQRSNVKNYRTTGFKRAELVYAPGRGPTLATRFTQGSLLRTDNPFDVAIQGAGFFGVTLPDGTVAYSRDGSFRYAKGHLTHATGPSMAAFPPFATNLEISPDGVVRGLPIDGDGGKETYSRIELYVVQNPETLEPLGRCLFRPTQATVARRAFPGQNGAGVLAQGHLEKSNINRTEEEHQLRELEEQQALVTALLKRLDPELVTPPVMPVPGCDHGDHREALRKSRKTFESLLKEVQESQRAATDPA